MAQVFLSYDREDGPKARLLAQALERAGHFVWWDLHIKGGAEYSREIEQALEQSEAVVVLWSAKSICSAWVRDEAAAGRDKGGLVPVLIEPVTPPMGFRQYQNLDLSAWKGRGKPPLDGLLTAIESIASVSVGRAHDRKGPAAFVPKTKDVRVATVAAAIAIAAIALLAALVSQPWRTESGARSVAVIPAEPSPAAGSLAADLLVKLGVLQSSYADALQLVDVESRQTPDFLIKVGGASVGRGAQAHLMLIDNRAGSLLWSGEFSEASGIQADLRQQMAYSAAKVLDCAVQALSAKNENIALPTLKLYLNGCANQSNLLAQDPRAAVAIFAKVAEEAPNFEHAWKKLLLAELQVLRGPEGSAPRALQNLQNHVAQARRLHPDIAEAFLADGWFRASGSVADWLALVQQALAQDPDNPDILEYHSLVQTNVGHVQEALADMRRAVKSDPLSPSARDALITALLNNGQVEVARNELKKSEQLWPGATSVLQARFAIEFRVGDAAQALSILQSGQLGPRFTPTSALESAAHIAYLKARVDPSARNKQQAISDARALYAQEPTRSWVLTRALSEFGAIDELLSFLMASDATVPTNTTWTLFRTSFAALHRDPRFMQVAARFGLLDYWTSTGRWPDFCSRSDLPYDCKLEAAKLS